MSFVGFRKITGLTTDRTTGLSSTDRMIVQKDDGSDPEKLGFLALCKTALNLSLRGGALGDDDYVLVQPTIGNAQRATVDKFWPTAVSANRSTTATFTSTNTGGSLQSVTINAPFACKIRWDFAWAGLVDVTSQEGAVFIAADFITPGGTSARDLHAARIDQTASGVATSMRVPFGGAWTVIESVSTSGTKTGTFELRTGLASKPNSQVLITQASVTAQLLP